MSAKNLSKSLMAWKYYLLFLWLIAAIFLGLIIYGIIMVHIGSRENPASELAITGAFTYGAALVLYCGFIMLNTYIRKKIGYNERASWWFLSMSWAVIGLIVIYLVFSFIQQSSAQDYYEKNVLPKEQACYEDYLNGKQSSPHCLQ